MIGGWEILLILGVLLLLFGGKRLPELARNLGKGVREFKKATQGVTEGLDTDPSEIEVLEKSSDTKEPS